MTLDQLRSNEAFVKWFGGVSNTPMFVELLKALDAGHPMRHTDGQPVTASSAEKKLGTIEGYELCLERIRICAQPLIPDSGMPTETFAPPETELTDEPQAKPI